MSAACNFSPKKLKHLENLRDIDNHWNNNEFLVKQFGKADFSNTRGSGVADRQINGIFREVLREQRDPDIPLDQLADYVRVKREIDSIGRRLLRRKVNTVYQLTQVPAMVHSLLPTSKKFLNDMNAATNFERNHRGQAEHEIAMISDNIKGALLKADSQGKLSAKAKLYFGKNAVNEIRKLERKIKNSQDQSEITSYQEQMQELIDKQAEGVLRDYFELVHKSSAEGREYILNERKNNREVSDEIKMAVKHTKDLLGRVTKWKTEKDSQGKKRKIPVEVDGLARVMLQTLDNTGAAINKLYGDGTGKEWVTISQDDIISFKGRLDSAKANIMNAVASGRYYPHRNLNNIVRIEQAIAKLGSVTDSKTLKADINELGNAIKSFDNWADYTTLPITDLKSIEGHARGRNKSLEEAWSRDPINTLDKYTNEVLVANRNSHIRKGYIDAIQGLGVDKYTADTSPHDFIHGMKKYLDMQYTRATEGFGNRPAEFNTLMRTLTGVQVLSTMGLGVLGAARNYLSGYYFHASQGVTGMRQAKKYLANDQDFVANELSRAVKKAGYEFKSNTTMELVAEGLNPETGINLSKVNWQIDRNGEVYMEYDGTRATGDVLKKLLDKSVQGSLVFHRWGENKLRKRIFELAFTDAFFSRVNNVEYIEANLQSGMSKESIDASIKSQRKKAEKFALDIAMDAVNNFAFEYSIHAKAPIISGTAPRLAKDGAIKMSARDYTTGVGSLVFQFMHYPMSFAAHQARTLKGTYDSVMSGQGLNSYDGRNLLGLAGIFGAVHLLSLAFNTDLKRMLPNDTVERIMEITEAFELRKNNEAKYGLLSQFTGPMVNKALFAMNYAGVMKIPYDTLSEALLGQMRYYEMSGDKKKQYLIQQIQNEIGKWNNKILPSMMRGDGMAGMIQQEFSLYPRAWTRAQRKQIGLQPKEEGSSDKVADLAKMIQEKRKPNPFPTQFTSR